MTVSRILTTLLLVVLAAGATAQAQAPTGTIAGVVADPKGSPIAGARVRLVNLDSGLTRNFNTSEAGDYTAAALPSGMYRVTAEAEGFSLLERTAIVEAGTTTTANLTLQVGEIRETVTVNTASPLINYESNQVGGVVTRKQIENLPLNGRNFLDLAALEPGMTSPIRGTNNRVFVPTLGAGLQNSPRIGQTRVTVDGASINGVTIIGAALQMSQEVVQEFQLSTVNFDLSTGVTTNGAVNVVTRSGGNDFHGSLFYFYRDHHLAAYPAIQRDPTNPHPFFQRQQYGFNLGGPIRKDRVFFFAAYERNNQRGVLSIQPRTPEFTPLGGIFPSPFLGKQFNLRLDLRLNPDHNAFVRYTHDGNNLFGPADGRNTSLPSGWSRVKNWVDQSLFALTSVLSRSLVNDLRFSYFFHSSPETPATAEDCPGCLGVGAPRINITDAGLLFGTARRLSVIGRRYQLTDSLVWQRGSHRFRFGFDWEHTAASSQNVDQEPASMVLYSPRQVQIFNAVQPPATRIPLPTSFTTLTDILRLPLRSFSTAVGPAAALQRDFRQPRYTDLFRLYAADTWRITPRLTLNYGLAWSYEPKSVNTDLSKPTLLVGILGPEGLRPPSAQLANFAPAVGFAWSATRDGKTVVRGGAGRYFDPAVFNTVNLQNERRALSPAGTGRRIVPGTAIFLPGRGVLNFPTVPTTFTAANLLAVLPGIRADLERQLNSENRDFTFRNVNLDKTGQNLSDPFYETPYALHFNLGVQRELKRGLGLSADFVWRRFLHTFLPDIDYNRFNRRISGVQTPVIPACTGAQRNDLTAVCSAGEITFDNTTGIAEYKGLLVRLEKRYSGRTQFLASYALGSYEGSMGPGPGFNHDDWFENYGPLPTDLRHILNFSGIVELPWSFQLSFNLSAYSRPPFSAFVSGVDFNGDGSSSDLLPGTRANQFNRGLDRAGLARLVERYNLEVAGRLLPNGQPAPTLTLPADYSFNDRFFTQNLRLSHTFGLQRERVRVILFGEVFNLFNTANLVGHSGNLSNPAEFGQPTGRFSQVFGSGGPRAFQFGARITF